ncbi:hypothetical protein H0X32_03630 [Patescibacteria group bacterium]|nr:hypothetical protein [Patescibacteria group bacterium]
MDTTPTPEKTSPNPPSPHKNASWGAILSIVVILAMIVIGAFYAWGKRIAEEHPLQQPNSDTGPVSY